MLNIEMKKADGVLCVELEGRLDATSSKDFANKIEAELEDVKKVVLDLENLEYISSAGLRAILAIQQHMEAVEGEDVCVRNANQMISDTLEITGFQEVINVE